MVKEEVKAMANDTIALCIQFFEQVKQFGKDANGKIMAPGHYKAAVMKDIDELMAGNMTFQKIHEAITTYVNRGPEKMKETYLVSHLLEAERIPYQKGVKQHNPDNLLMPMKFYYHQALQITPPPPVVVQLPDGSFHSSYEPFYLEIRESFTVDDLVDYFYSKAAMTASTTRDKDKGAFRHMLKTYDVDFLLHLIDEAFAQALDRGAQIPHEPFMIQEYVAETHLVYENRKNICYEGGFDRVIPRTRTE